MSDSEKVENILLNGYLECPICLDFAVSPIHTCENGHLVCGICVEKTKACPTCQDLNLRVNKFVERILKAEGALVPCRNSQHGCTLRLSPSEMMTHLAEDCDIRPIRCNQLGESCEGKSYHPKELFKHWVDFHKIVEMFLVLPSNSTNSSSGFLATATAWFSVLEEDYRTDCRSDADRFDWGETYVEIEDRFFIFHSYTEGGTFYACVTLVGMESDGVKYDFLATLSGYENKAEKQITFPRIPIQSLQLYYTNKEKIADLGHMVAVSLKSLKFIGDEKLKDPENALEWSIRFDIFNKEDPTNTKKEELEKLFQS